MMGLPYGEEIMIIGRTMWTQSTSVTDGRTELRSQRPCNAERRTVTTTHTRILVHFLRPTAGQLVCKYINENWVAVFFTHRMCFPSSNQQHRSTKGHNRQLQKANINMYITIHQIRCRHTAACHNKCMHVCAFFYCQMMTSM